MALSKEDVQAISALVPVALQLGRTVYGLARKARDEGYVVPGRAELAEMNEQIKALEDLAGEGETEIGNLKLEIGKKRNRHA